ncbi:hypothetical protein GCM10009687_41110 [Asanoa iriomotensis]|uniref:Uncharacterized protein n=1 Tax=Asanoa iriomotensis TaxID=234613 RepID=A0ABQ4BZ08_9ACTN|nr:hypothetical protein Air01nite_18420 [Asanoa iriomotensis]
MTPGWKGSSPTVAADALAANPMDRSNDMPHVSAKGFLSIFAISLNGQTKKTSDEISVRENLSGLSQDVKIKWPLCSKWNARGQPHRMAPHGLVPGTPHGTPGTLAGPLPPGRFLSAAGDRDGNDPDRPARVRYRRGGSCPPPVTGTGWPVMPVSSCSHGS